MADIYPATSQEKGYIQQLMYKTATNVNVERVERVVNPSAWDYLDLELKRATRKGLQWE